MDYLGRLTALPMQDYCCKKIISALTLCSPKCIGCRLHDWGGKAVSNSGPPFSLAGMDAESLRPWPHGTISFTLEAVHTRALKNELVCCQTLLRFFRDRLQYDWLRLPFEAAHELIAWACCYSEDVPLTISSASDTACGDGSPGKGLVRGHPSLSAEEEGHSCP